MEEISMHVGISGDYPACMSVSGASHMSVLTKTCG